MDQNTEHLKTVIRCPHCGYEYTPSEIFMPGELIGKASTVIRDPLGKIIYAEYHEEPDQTERYVCDGCNKPFIIKALTIYKTKEEAEELDFSDTSASLLDD